MTVAVVTGAAQGIGQRIAEVLALSGYQLAVIDQQPTTVDGALCLTGDVSNEQDVSDAARAVLDAYGRVDVLVNNAGIACISPAEQTPPELWRRVLDVNLTGPFLLCQAFGSAMLAQRSGSIINIASVAGLMGVADRAAYNASKHGLVGLTRTLAVEWGGRGVRVNAVCPGWVKTPMDDASQGEGAYGDTDITDHVPLARFATPDDVAQARSSSSRIPPAAGSSTEPRSRSTAAGSPTGRGRRYASVPATAESPPGSGAQAAPKRVDHEVYHATPGPPSR
jgi:NAD(P)-dependent dehydrogenase (short-subunit alcohol dehydrogenase family)